MIRRLTARRHDRSIKRPAGRNPYFRRRGFSLLEVLIATAILMGSAVVLSRLAGMGREQSVRAKLRSEALQLCENTLNELLLGLRPLEPVSAAPLLAVLPDTLPAEAEADQLNADASSFQIAEPGQADQTALSGDTDPPWKYSVVVSPRPDLPGIWSVTVIVVQGDQTLKRPLHVSLTRWIQGPAERLTDSGISNDETLFESPTPSFNNDGGGL